MDLPSFLTRMREHYIRQFEEFVARQEKACVQGHAEVKFQIPDSDYYDQLLCVDYAKNDAGVEFVFFHPDLMLMFEPVTGTVGGMTFQIEALRWDSVVFHHDSNEISSAGIREWFDKWFDPDDRRHDPTAKLGSVVHSLTVKLGRFEIDFGTAQVGAMLDLLQLLEETGSTYVRIDGATPRPN
jgi:hypothetical protein